MGAVNVSCPKCGQANIHRQQVAKTGHLYKTKIDCRACGLLIDLRVIAGYSHTIKKVTTSVSLVYEE